MPRIRLVRDIGTTVRDVDREVVDGELVQEPNLGPSLHANDSWPWKYALPLGVGGDAERYLVECGERGAHDLRAS